MKNTASIALFPMLLLSASGPAGAAVISFSNTTSIAVPGGAPGVSSGIANPYPSKIEVLGLSGTITSLTVTLHNISHTSPADMDVLMVGPTGASVILLSDLGGQTDITGIDLTFATGAPTIGTTIQLVSGTFAPTNYNPFGASDSFTGAPSGPYGNSLTVFNGLSANGEWRLFVVDDAIGDIGAIAGGWSLGFTMSGGPAAGVPETGSTFVLLALALSTIAAFARQRPARECQRSA